MTIKNLQIKYSTNNYKFIYKEHLKHLQKGNRVYEKQNRIKYGCTTFF